MDLISFSEISRGRKDMMVDLAIKLGMKEMDAIVVQVAKEGNRT
jgi:sRNA-binding protein